MGTAGAATSCLHQIPVIPVASARGIVDALPAHPGTGAAARQPRVLEFGPDPGRAAALVTVLEEAARAEVAAAALGGAVDFPPGALESERAWMARARR
jgi:L-ribulose-5-phosphate 4-epimerase